MAKKSTASEPFPVGGMAQPEERAPTPQPSPGERGSKARAVSGTPDLFGDGGEAAE